ncbi:MAG: response regulator [Alistipes shahii]
MDLRLPVMDGLKRRAVSGALSPGVPIVAMSAYSCVSDVGLARKEAGCNEFLIKPLSLMFARQGAEQRAGGPQEEVTAAGKRKKSARPKGVRTFRCASGLPVAVRNQRVTSNSPLGAVVREEDAREDADVVVADCCFSMSPRICMRHQGGWPRSRTARSRPSD